MATRLAKHDTAIVDSGASGWYFTPDAPVSNVNKTAATIRVGTETGQAQTSHASCKLPLPDLPPGLFGHIMSRFTHNLFGITNICDKDWKVLFKKTRLLSITATISRFWRDGEKLTVPDCGVYHSGRIYGRIFTTLRPDMKTPRLILKKKKPLLNNLAHMNCHT